MQSFSEYGHARIAQRKAYHAEQAYLRQVEYSKRQSINYKDKAVREEENKTLFSLVFLGTIMLNVETCGGMKQLHVMTTLTNSRGVMSQP